MTDYWEMSREEQGEGKKKSTNTLLYTIVAYHKHFVKREDLWYNREKGENMFFVSEVFETAPKEFKNELQEKVYKTLEELKVPFKRVDTGETRTMEDCVEIDKKLDTKIVKTLFVCNRQETNFYVFATLADKKFDTKKFSQELEIPRVSFVKEEKMKEVLGTNAGAATILGCLLDKEGKVQVVIDKDVLSNEEYGCTDGTTTGYMKMKTKDVFEKVLPFAGHKEKVIEM